MVSRCIKRKKRHNVHLTKYEDRLHKQVIVALRISIKYKAVTIVILTEKYFIIEFAFINYRAKS
ncbi:hypothetical protein CAP35_05600 [Chitinophagaceae bacterium IBVUCB1]|nr:hypothetical protein CAP35_05600 [Chitinophagaceae bacterium IBVUCB1]